jgi:hypothetical protein
MERSLGHCNENRFILSFFDLSKLDAYCILCSGKNNVHLGRREKNKGPRVAATAVIHDLFLRELLIFI